jgi:chromosomal replication initiator protein
LAEFIVGPENALARAVMDGLIETLQASSPSCDDSTNHTPDFDRFQPLVLSGPTGAGKSLFVHTLIRAWQKLRPRDSIMLTTGVDFAREYVEAIDRRQINSWREMVRGSALLVIDDLPQFAEKNAAQTELVQTIDMIADRGGLTIFLSRVSLERCRDALSPALVGRLHSGVLVDLHAPEFDTRYEILRRFGEQRNVSITPSALRLLAQGLRGNVPELFSAVMTLESRCDLPRRSVSRGDVLSMPASLKTIDTPEARKYVAEIDEAKTPSLRAIANYTARHFTLTVTELKSASRRQAIVQARDVAMFLARQLTSKSLDEIGRFFGGRDHTTVLHGCRKTEQMIKTDQAIRQAVEYVQSALALA